MSFFFLSQRKPKKIVSGEKGLAHGKVNCVSNNSTLYSAIFLFYFIFLIFLILKSLILSMKGFPGSTEVKNLPANAGNKSRSIPGSGRPPGGGNDNPLQHSCLDSSMDREARQAGYSLWGCKEFNTTGHRTKEYFKLATKCDFF